MYINPFLAGVISTLFVETLVLLAYGFYLNAKKK